MSQLPVDHKKQPSTRYCHFCGMEEAGEGQDLGGYEGIHAVPAAHMDHTKQPSTMPPLLGMESKAVHHRCNEGTQVPCRPSRRLLAFSVWAASGVQRSCVGNQETQVLPGSARIASRSAGR